MSNIGEEDIWGEKFWDCSFSKETGKEVTVNYTGYYETKEGQRLFNELGKCSVTVSILNLCKNWTVRKLSD